MRFDDAMKRRPRLRASLAFFAISALGHMACGFQQDILVDRAASTTSSEDAAPSGSSEAGSVTGALVAASDERTFGVMGSRTFVWGAVSAVDTNRRELAPVPLPDSAPFASICAGGVSACGIEAATGAVACWGSNDKGQLGAGDHTPNDVPRRAILPRKPAALACGDRHVCAVLVDGSLWCWGANDESQLGRPAPSLTDAPLPVQVEAASDWIAVGAGQGHTCGVRAPGHLYCWGRNHVDQVGLGNAANAIQITAPTRVDGAGDWARLDLGQNSTCAIRQDGSLWCWGRTDTLDLGDAGRPKRVGADNDWVDVSAGAFVVCGRRGDGRLWCFGRNYEGQLGLGDGAPLEVASPMAVSPDRAFTHVSVGRFHTCATRAPDEIWCTGMNDFGQVGVGQAVANVRSLTRVAAP